MMNLAEYRRRPALLADWLPWAGLVAPGVVLNKDGSFQRTARFRGPDLDEARRDIWVPFDAINAASGIFTGCKIFSQIPRGREAA